MIVSSVAMKWFQTLGKATFSAQSDWPSPKMIWNRSPSFTTFLSVISFFIHHLFIIYLYFLFTTLSRIFKIWKVPSPSPCSPSVSQRCSHSWRKYIGEYLCRTSSHIVRWQRWRVEHINLDRLGKTESFSFCQLFHLLANLCWAATRARGFMWPPAPQ